MVGLGVGVRARRKVGHPIGEIGHQADQLAAVATESLAQFGAGALVDVVAQCLHERLIGNSHPLVAATVQDHGPVVAGREGQLGGQA